MLRLRFYKILLPIVLVVFLVMLVKALDPPEASHTDLAPTIAPTNSVRGVIYTEFDGSRKVYDLDANSVEEEDGRVKVDEIRGLDYYREGRGALKFSAGHADISGGQGERILRFDTDVVFQDPDKELTLRIPSLELDQKAEEARSGDTVELLGSTLAGSARGLVYGLSGQPGRLTDLELTDSAGARLSSRRAVLHDGLRDVELLEAVRVSRGEEFLGSERMRIFRRQDDSLKRLEALDSVSAVFEGSGAEAMSLDSDTLNLDFDDQGEILTLEASNARFDAGLNHLEAQTLRARRVGAAAHEWSISTDGDVRIESRLGDDPARLTADVAVALLDRDLALIEATASGRVRFEAGPTRAEADWAALFATRDEVRLVGSAKRKARLAHLSTRVAAERIITDSRGVNLVAEHEVEATLLAAKEGAAPRTGLFTTDSAVHFLARKLEGKNSGSLLTFTGAVRGWQGDRTLSGDVLVLDQAAETLSADGNVAARIPRNSEQGGTGEADYIQIGSERLDYSDKTRVAEFQEEVRVQIAEGWVEGQVMQVTLSDGSGGIELIEAEGDVLLEFHEAADEGPPRLMTGKADRMKYDPTLATVWLMGDNAPATVRRVGADEGTTSGRVLRYQLDDGTLEVDSGTSGPARIRTSER